MYEVVCRVGRRRYIRVFKTLTELADFYYRADDRIRCYTKRALTKTEYMILARKVSAMYFKDRQKGGIVERAKRLAEVNIPIN